ncbi:MAG TPA: M3 family metallopeptidase [Bryobacteraceae bacterium]|jgi:oligopeptidase A|nr:M3 family metallopeptidase [Bryobacteraceae bacterium]
MSDNPLLAISFHIPFDRIRVEHVEPGVTELLRQSKEHIDEFVRDRAPRTFDNTMLALERATENLDYALAVVRHLEGVATTPELRAAWNVVEPLASEFYSSIPLNEGIWKQLQAYAATDEAKALTGTRLRFLTKTLDSFRRHGAELDAAGKKRMAEIDVELTRVTTKFAENVLDSTNAFELIVTDEAKLAGLPPSAVAAARQSFQLKNPDSKDAPGWRFTLQAPSYIPVLTYLEDRDIREKMYRAYSARATEPDRDNRPILARILELRREKATMLGFPDFADFVLHDRMAHKGERAIRFLDELKEKTNPFFAKENAALEAFAGQKLEPWDIGYWAEKQRQALYDFNEEELRPYFPAENVVEGMFGIVERLYGIQVKRREDVPVWHPDVRYYEIREKDGQLIGAFYADWYPRETKRDGAWMEAFITGVDAPGHFEPHAGCVCGNLTPPVGDRPALLTHREVETIFHEFGHLLHHVLSRVEVRSLAGTAVAWDFVELPSQIMENWCWERDALNLFARHYQTGEPIPEDLFQKMVRARTYRGANMQMRQLGFGFTDLKLHRDYTPARDGDVIQYARTLLQPFSAAKFPPNYAMIAGFTHLFASPVGYGAGYYSYKWAEVLDADAFTRFRDEGIFSPEAGGDFRKYILSRGDSEDPAELYRRFMGRDPDPDALLIRSGLIS